MADNGDARRERVKESHRRAIESAARQRELTVPLVEAVFEAATYRGWKCPRHGPVGLKVDARDRCVAVMKKVKKTGLLRLCARMCTHDGPLERKPKEIGAVLSTFIRNSGGVPVVLQDLGVSKLPNLTINDNRSVNQHAAIPLWVYDMLTPEQKDEYAARMKAAEAPKALETATPVAVEVKTAEPALEVSSV